MPDRVALEDTARARVFQQHAGRAGRVGYLEDLAGMRAYIADSTHDAVRRNHRHIGSETVVRAFVEVEQPAMVRAAGPNHLRRHCLVYIMLFKGEQLLQPLALPGILGERCLLQLQALVLFDQRLVLLLHVYQVDVARPDAPEGEPALVQNLLRRRHDGRNAHPQYLHPGLVGRGRTWQLRPHLYGEQDKLRQKHQREHQGVLVAGEKGFHQSSL